MENFVFGIENYCNVKFIGDDHDPKKYYWFSNIERVMLKNGFGLDDIIGHGNEVYDVTGMNNYFEIEYEGKKRYFEDLFLNTYIINKAGLNAYFKPIDVLLERKIKFMFLIDAGDYVKIDRIYLSPKVLEAIKSGLCKVVLNTSYEPYSQEQINFIEILRRFAYKYGLNYNTLKVVSGNLIVKNNINDPYEFYPYCYFLENPWFVQKDVFATDAFYVEGQQKISQSFQYKLKQFIEVNRTIKGFDKKILCYNRRPHPHRRFLFYRLYHHDLIRENTYLSLNNEEPFIEYKYHYMYGTTFEESNIINQFFITNRKKWDFDGLDLHVNLANNFEESFHKKTFVSLVSETSASKDLIFFSEKIFKPIYACQPFIISGNPNSLKKLKELGFKTFDKWWDESYDEEIRFEHRLEKIMKILTDISLKTDEELITMLNEMEDILVHNYNVFIGTNNEYFYKTFSSIGHNNNYLI